MNIEILQLIEGAKKAQGLTVIIDVFRAFTTACYIIKNGASQLYSIGDIETAYMLKKQNPEAILIGERNEMKPEGFDYANSPTQIEHLNLKGKIVIHTTSSGTQGIVNATGADEIITGSFVNLNAIVSYIKKQQPTHVSLVCMGYAAQYPTDEDTFCAEFIRNSLLNKPTDFEKMLEILRTGAGKRFFELEKQSYSPSRDFYLCTQLNTFDFVLKVKKNKYAELIKINISEEN